MTDWEKRAEELFPVIAPHEYMMGPMSEWRARALQLGREMADELRGIALNGPTAEKLRREAADTRAEEIAKAIEARKKERIRPAPSALFIQQGLIDAAEIARSFVEKKAELRDCLVPPGLDPEPVTTAWDDAAGRMLGRELAREGDDTVPCKRIEPIDIAAYAKRQAAIDEAALRADEREKIARRIGSYKISQPYSDDWHRGFGQAIETATDLALWDPKHPKVKECPTCGRKD